MKCNRCGKEHKIMYCKDCYNELNALCDEYSETMRVLRSMLDEREYYECGGESDDE